MIKFYGSKKILCLVLGIMLILALVGCGSNSGSTATEKSTESAVKNETTAKATEPAKTYTLAFNNFNDTNVFCKQVHDSIKANCDKYGVKLLYAEAGMDAQKVSANIDNFILQKADIIFEFNWLPEVAKVFVPKCTAAGIPVIAGDARYDGAYFFGANNQVAGEKLGEYAANKIKEKWDGKIDKLVITYFMGGGDELKKRMGGIVDAYRKIDPTLTDDKVVWFDNTGDAVKTKAIVTDYLTAHPGEKHILFAANNDEGGLGALSAIETANRQNDCLIISHGGDIPFQDAVRKGKGDIWIGSVSYAPERYGEFLVPYALDILAGKDVPKEMSPEHVVITKDNIDQYYPVKK